MRMGSIGKRLNLLDDTEEVRLLDDDTCGRVIQDAADRLNVGTPIGRRRVDKLQIDSHGARF